MKKKNTVAKRRPSATKRRAKKKPSQVIKSKAGMNREVKAQMDESVAFIDKVNTLLASYASVLDNDGEKALGERRSDIIETLEDIDQILKEFVVEHQAFEAKANEFYAMKDKDHGFMLDMAAELVMDIYDVRSGYVQSYVFAHQTLLIDHQD